ncbi:hypothetical protein B0H13DRAFT_1971276 [Mycena leptocephala]|nr:hypothetical protein B0H13DRAFT_1971276 [Mycena leptocephala]
MVCHPHVYHQQILFYLDACGSSPSASLRFLYSRISHSTLLLNVTLNVSEEEQVSWGSRYFQAPDCTGGFKKPARNMKRVNSTHRTICVRIMQARSLAFFFHSSTALGDRDGCTRGLPERGALALPLHNEASSASARFGWCVIFQLSISPLGKSCTDGCRELPAQDLRIHDAPIAAPRRDRHAHNTFVACSSLHVILKSH